MNDDDTDDGVPDSDPRHIDPAHDIATAVEDGELSGMRLGPDADRDGLEEFIERAESGEFGAEPGVEAMVRIARELLDRDPADGGER